MQVNSASHWASGGAAQPVAAQPAALALWQSDGGVPMAVLARVVTLDSNGL